MNKCYMLEIIVKFRPIAKKWLKSLALSEHFHKCKIKIFIRTWKNVYNLSNNLWIRKFKLETSKTNTCTTVVFF